MGEQPDDAEGASARIRRAYARRARFVDPGRYSLLNPGNLRAIHERDEVLLRRLRAHGIADLGAVDVLEIGCGSGSELARFIALGVHPDRLYGVDIRDSAVKEAQARTRAHVRLADAAALPFDDDTFGLTFQFTAFSSMPTPAMRQAAAAEMMRVTKSGGLMVSYDFVRNPRNTDTVGIDRKELGRIFPGLKLEFHRLTIAPPIGRWIGAHWPRLLWLVTAIPGIRTHLLTIARLPDQASGN